MNISLGLRTTFARALRPQTTAYAHCDIPCGIYDPHEAQLAAETVEKMTQLIIDLPAAAAGDASAQAHYSMQIARYTAIKEQHAERVKHEVRIIWGDYFNPERMAATPDLHTKVWNIMKVASQTRQGVNIDAAKSLRTAVNEFADIFWATKK
ncbi:MAG: superoxide dismutase, Ni [Dehalococcoidia bacterium]|nr:superoxide dismutase, Ni [Dehalococcoidia bacterium]